MITAEADKTKESFQTIGKDDPLSIGKHLGDKTLPQNRIGCQQSYQGDRGRALSQ